MKRYILMFFVLGWFCSCHHQPSFKDKVCSRYIGKELVYFPDSEMVNRHLAKESRYKLLHSMDITCSSCLHEILDNASFIQTLERYDVSFEIVGYSSYQDSIFDSVLLQYPFYFDFYRKFRTRNRILDDNIVRTFLLDGKKILFAGDIKEDAFKEQVLSCLEKEH